MINVIDAYSYSITIRKTTGENGQVFEAKILELPDVTEYADTAIEAYELAIDTIEVAAKIFFEAGKNMPRPYSPEEED